MPMHFFCYSYYTHDASRDSIQPMKISVIVSTYNSPLWLQKVLWGFCAQEYTDFEVVIADDGSGPETKELIESMRNECPFPIVHVWHEDDGFRKCEILNKAITASSADYLAFTDGDCIPHPRFLRIHATYAKKGHMLSGGYLKLPMELSENITKEDILQHRVISKKWLWQQSYKSPKKLLKLTNTKWLADFMDGITPANASWNGHNASTFKESILAVNGFDERMEYGAEDREFGERLMNMGIKPIQIRHKATCLHLDHARGYVNKEALKRNRDIRQQTKKNKAIWTEYGIKKN